jgi:predicted AlkP superfamily pyrophosphatase or phosphodiesterase
MKNLILGAFLAVLSISCVAQTPTVSKATQSAKTTSTNIYTKPKLVVGIVVDQMRYDYLTRFWDKYGNGGFKKMVNEGFNCKNNHFNYIPTYTGPGHASVYTGTIPAVHGVIGNNWYDKTQDLSVYCASDKNYKSVGTESNAGRMSPHRMLTTTVTDELRLASQMRAKVIGVAIKDRGAVLPAGHTGNAAFWFEGKKEGNWITSSFYMDELPQWVNNFNNSQAAEAYKKEWNTLYDINTYVESGSDANNYEGRFKGKSTATFPYNLPEIWEANGGFDLLKATPYGNSLTTDFALAAIDGEGLGQDAITDFLAVSYSSTDYVGHQFGVNSKEIQDTYLRLDKDLERLFSALDEKVGEGQYTVFLTADHGAVNVPSYLSDLHIPSGYFNIREDVKKLREYLKFKFGSDKLIRDISNNQIFLDREMIANLDLELKEVEETIVNHIITYKDYTQAFGGTTMRTTDFTQGIPELLQNGYNHKRSGDVLLVPSPATIIYSRTGSTHGSGLMYDTHVPLLFFGKGIKSGSTTKRTVIPDVAPTISALLGISFPSGATGKPVSQAID